MARAPCADLLPYCGVGSRELFVQSATNVTRGPNLDKRFSGGAVGAVGVRDGRGRRARRPRQSVRDPGQLVAQGLPLRVNAVGAVLVAPLLAMKPTVTEPAAGMVEV